jgi:hypothetical protein
MGADHNSKHIHPHCMFDGGDSTLGDVRINHELRPER